MKKKIFAIIIVTMMLGFANYVQAADTAFPVNVEEVMVDAVEQEVTSLGHVLVVENEDNISYSLWYVFEKMDTELEINNGTEVETSSNLSIPMPDHDPDFVKIIIAIALWNETSEEYDSPFIKMVDREILEEESTPSASAPPPVNETEEFPFNIHVNQVDNFMMWENFE